MSELPPKPRYMSPCNHCGKCCMTELCPAGAMLFPGAAGPCPLLLIRDGQALCGLVLEEKLKNLEPKLAISLGIGYGCSMVDDDTSETLTAYFTAKSLLRADQEWAAIVNARPAKI